MEAVDEAVVVPADEAADIALVQGEMVVEEGGICLAVVVVLVEEMMTKVTEVSGRSGVVEGGLEEEEILTGRIEFYYILSCFIIF